MSSKTLLTRMFAVFGIASFVFLAGCGGGMSQSLNNPHPPPGGTNPVPTINSLSPNRAVASSGAFMLAINGTNFMAASMVKFGETTATTTFVSATQLTAAIPATSIASVEMVAVTVTNPSPGGGTSNAVSFTITGGGNSTPTLNSLSPSCGPKGVQVLNPLGPNGQLVVNGQNFVATSVVRWNGSDRPTSFLSSSQLTAQISASDIAAPGTAAVTVFNPPPGGGSSNTSTFTIDAGGMDPQSIALDPSGKFAYVANLGCELVFGNVSMYTIDPTTGILTSIGPPVVPSDEGTQSVAVDPLGKFAYIANTGQGDTAGSISAYTINSTTGALTSTGMINGVCPGLCSPSSVAVDRSGKFAYVANEGGPAPTTVSMYTIDATTGALTSIGTVAAGGRAISVAVDPSGKFAYVADVSDGFPGENNNVSMYTINAATGALTSIGTIAAGTKPLSVAVDPTDKFAYVTNSGSNDVSTYSINSMTGALTSKGTVPSGSSPTSIATHPSGKFAYATNSGSNDVSMYSIDGITGALTSKGTVPSGSGPSSIAIHPSGKFAYVTNSGSNDISMYSIDAASGTLTLMGTIGT